MATHTFYAVENHHNERQVRILSVGSLVSKPPTKEKRISVKVRMPLSGTVNMGAPEWIDNAFLYVSKNGGDQVSPQIEFKGYALEFSVENLFGESVSTPSCSMRKFEIFEAGDAENPDVVMEFGIRFGFSTATWGWLGQYVGDDVWVKFTPGVPGEANIDEQDGTLLDDGDNDEDDEGDDDTSDDELEYDPDANAVVEINHHGKSDAKTLAAYHENVVEAEQKRGRGRPRKTPVDPLTVNVPTSAF